MPDTPLNPDALEAAAKATMGTVYGKLPTEEMHVAVARAAVSAYLAVAQPVVTSVESLPAQMRMLAWEGGEFEVGEIPEGHVLVGFEMATDRAWSMADKVTINIERKDTTNGR